MLILWVTFWAYNAKYPEKKIQNEVELEDDNSKKYDKKVRFAGDGPIRIKTNLQID